jgi:hypothetical protein
MSRLQTKWISDNAISALKIRLANDNFLRARNAADTADINLLKVNASNMAEFGAEPIYSGVPTMGTSLVNKQFVMDVIAGVRDPKDAVRAATTADLDLAEFPGTLDGVVLSVGNRVLVKNQDEASENGIYVFNGANLPVTRATDFDENHEVKQGASTDVVEGTINGNTRWLLTTVEPDVGVGPLVFVKTPTPQDQVAFKRNVFVLNSTDVANGYVDLTNIAQHQSLIVWPDGGLPQRIVSDYSLANNGVGDVTRLTFAGDLVSNLAANDVLIVNFAHF